MSDQLSDREYIGDGVYVGLDEFGAVWLSTSDGLSETNRICLEPEVLAALERWMARIKSNRRGG